MAQTVADFMTRDPICVHPETPLKEAIQLLADHRISGLPVVSTDQKAPVGVLSETDLMWQASGVTPPAYILLLDSVIYLKNPATYDHELHKALGQTVGEVMSPRPVTIAPGETLAIAARLMHERRIHRLLVMETATEATGSSALVGILTRGDIVRALAAGL